MNNVMTETVYIRRGHSHLRTHSLASLSLSRRLSLRVPVRLRVYMYDVTSKF